MSQAEQAQLDAGGFVALKARVDAQATEEIVARRYGGAALGQRLVVRLGAERLGPAEDLAMEYLGLEPRGSSPPLARQTRRALGFANWALTYHREHARYALDLVKRIKAAARRAQSKPGHAWDEFTAMADELNKSVRHFLPAFWEEAARIYKDTGNATYAGRALNKALEAERVHALDVDPEHRRDAVLEFTLSGCLSGKALSEYAQDLQNQFEPAEAYATLRDLVVRRTLGGMAPTAGMGKDLIRAAKAAGLDADREIEAVLEEIIGSPAMPRAPLQFWESVRPHVRRLVARNTTFAVWLLVHTDPQPRYSGDSTVWAWLDLLDDWNVLPLLSAAELPAEPEIPGGRAGWIGRLVRVEISPNKRVFELLEQMAEVLRREGRPVPLFSKPRWGSPPVDVDVLETCLDLGIPLAEPPEEFELNFDGWLRADLDHPRRNSQLEHVARHERFGERMRAKIPELIPFSETVAQGHRSYGRQLPPRRRFEQAAADHPAVHDVWWQYLDGLLVALESGGLPEVERALGGLRLCVGKQTGTQFPELLPRLQQVDLVGCLHRTIRAGVLDEYGWEPLEQAVQEHKLPAASARHHQQPVFWIFPLGAYVSSDRLIVVRSDRVDPPRELNLKTSQQLQVLLPAGDDVAVGYRDQAQGWSERLFWTSDPRHEVEPKDSLYGCVPETLVAVQDGVFYGSRVVRPGDTTLPRAQDFFHDGSRFWRQKEVWQTGSDGERPPATLAEIDPATGKEIRDSIPAWFEEDLPAGAEVQWQHSMLLPLPAELDASPLGARGGLIGWKVTRRRDGRLVGRGIDGRQFSSGDWPDRPQFRSLVPLAMMDQPGGDSHWVFTDRGWVIEAASGVCLADEQGRGMTYRAGQAAALPLEFLHLMRIRHEPTSRKLRQLERADAERLLDAGVIEDRARTGRAEQGDPARRAASAAVEQLLPDAPPRLVTGLARIARLCAEERLVLERICTAVELGEIPLLPERPDSEEDEEEQVFGRREVSDPTSEVGPGLAQLQIPSPTQSYYGGHSFTDNERHLREALEFLAGKREGPLSPCDLPWLNLLADLPGIAWRTLWRLGTVEGATSISQRLHQPWLQALEFLADSGVLDLPGAFRLHLASPVEGPRATGFSITAYRDEKIPAWSQGANRYIAQTIRAYPEDKTHILEYAPQGEFQAPNGYVVECTQPLQLGWRSADLQSFIQAVRSVEELPYAAPEQLEPAAAQLGVSSIEVAVVWMGDLRTVVYGNDSLTKEIRSRYGWKVKPVQAAIAALQANPVPPAVIAAPVLADPAGACSGAAPAFDALVAAWKTSQQASVRFAPELVALLNKSVPRYAESPTTALIQVLSEGSQPAMLKPRKFEFYLGEEYRIIQVRYTPEQEGYEEALLQGLAGILGLINYSLPAGDAARRLLPDLIDIVRRYLDAPETVLPFGGPWATDDVQKFSADEILARYSQVLGPLELGADGIYRFDDGLIAAGLVPPFVGLLFRPARLTDEAAYQRLIAVAGQTRYWGTTGEGQLQLAEATRQLRSESITRIAELNRGEPAAAGGWDQDPRNSAPATVAEVRQRLKLEEDAAAYYLQVLALPDPTHANVARWTGWTSKQIKQVAASLVAAGLLVEAKRARAGRDVFLPGGWEALKAPNLPLESWKLPLYNSAAAGTETAGPRLIAVVQPVGDLFAAAWQRVVAGDAPRYEER